MYTGIVFNIFKMKMIKGQFDDRYCRRQNVFKLEKLYWFLKVQYTVTKTISGKSISHLPSGDKT